jgi:hypothetical protein
MKKTYLLWFAILAFLMVSCRNENFNTSETSNDQQALKFRVIPKSEIPQIMNALQAKTNNFKVPLRSHSSAIGRTETVFGEINTDFIIEKQNDGDTYYVFAIRPSEESSKGYNLELKANESENYENAKVLEYIPTDEWLASGDGDFSKFSGTINTYSLDGELTSVVTSVNGEESCPKPEPCPDCPTNPNGPGGGGGGIPGGPGGGTDGGGSPGGGWTGGGSGSGSGSTSSGGCGDWTLSYYIRDNHGNITGAVYTNGCETVKVNFKMAGRNVCDPINSGSGGGITIYDQTKTPCGKTKAMIERSDVKPKLDELYEKSKSQEGGEIAFMMKNDGIPSSIIPGGEHSVDLTNMQNHKGVYHNHTNKKGDEGIKMVSTKDIYALFSFVVKQPAGALVTDAFVGMVGAQPCAVAGDCKPDGYEMFNYVIRFSGTYQDAEGIFLKNYDFKTLRDKYREFENTTRNKSGNSSQYGNYISKKGLEELFFYILGKMEIPKNKMILQRIDKDGNVTNVTLGTDGKPKDVACP